MNKIQIPILLAGLFVCTAIALPNLLAPLTPVVNGVGTIIPQVPTTAAGALNAAKEIFNNLPTTEQENVNRTTTVVFVLLRGQLTFDTIWSYLLTGFLLASSGNTNTTNSVGGLGLPTETLCQLGVQYQYSNCYVCHQDCYVAHNLWGGGCGPSPLTGEATCLCAESAEEAQQRNLTANSTTTCAAFNPAAKEEAYLIAIAFRLRYIAVQCLAKTDGTYDSTGCNVDCVQNHGFVSGTCQKQVPNVALPYGTYPSGNDKPTAFCICSHDNSPNTTFTDPSSYGSGGNLLTGIGSYGG